jgi:hypothetical protein
VFAAGHLGELTGIVPPEMIDAALEAAGGIEQGRRRLPSRVGPKPLRELFRLVAGPGAVTAGRAVRSGTPVTIIPSPPGAGKTTILIELAIHLLLRADETVTVATPTNRGGADVAARLVRRLAPDSRGKPRVSVRGSALNAILDPATAEAIAASTENAPTIEITTLTGLAIRGSNSPGILVVDEAWRATFADVTKAADPFDQIVLVGDPGQIGPVVTAPTRMWEGSRFAPHMPAPSMFAQPPDSIQVPLRHTFRLGDQGVGIVSPLYDFPFDSPREPRRVETPEGRAAWTVTWVTGGTVGPFWALIV